MDAGRIDVVVTYKVDRLNRALYIAAITASRYDPKFKAFRQRLQGAGKPIKLAMAACARKLLAILIAMFRNSNDYRSA